MKRVHFSEAIFRAFSCFVLAVLLAGATLRADAQNLGWEPLTMDFGQVPIGSTAYQTLTLTNTDPGAVIDIWNVEFTFNDRGVFGLTTSEPLPADLLPGETMTVEFSFTPTEGSFFLADVLITNDSTNAPSLHYSMLGQGVSSDPCYPQTSCGGVCVDLMTDVGNCGSCGNICTAPLNGTAVCDVGLCGFVCAEGYERVGDGCQPIVPQTAVEMLEALIAFVDESVTSGALVGLGPKGTDTQSATHRLLLFTRMLDEALYELKAGNEADACSRLNFAHLRSDGGYPFVMPPDFVAGEATGEVHARILAIMEALEACEISVAPTRPER